MKLIKGNLITLAKQGEFDHIAHGCNCFATQKSGLAPQMAKAFGTDKFHMESDDFEPYERLGNIGHHYLNFNGNGFKVWNWYTQYRPGKNFDYYAFITCCRKFRFANQSKLDGRVQSLGLPKIGSLRAGGDWEKIEMIIDQELDPYFNVTIIEWDGTYDN